MVVDQPRQHQAAGRVDLLVAVRPVPTATIDSPSIRTSASNASVAVTTRPPRMSLLIPEGYVIRGPGFDRSHLMERVWDYPRPPAVVRCERRVRVELGGGWITATWWARSRAHQGRSAGDQVIW